MKRLILLLLTLSLFTASFAQVLKERRVYYLDCSFSMVTPNKIWDKVCDNLINAIENVEDETTELIVVPFAFDNQHHNALNAYKELATPQGKANLKNKIRSIKPNKSTMTYHDRWTKRRKTRPNARITQAMGWKIPGEKCLWLLRYAS